MRGGLAVITLGLALAAPAGAQVNLGQNQQAAQFFNGANPRKLTFTPINTGKAFKQINGQIIRPPSQSSPISLGHIFHGFPSILSWPPRIGQSAAPQPAAR